MNIVYDINNPFEREIKGTQSKLHLVRKEDNQQSSYNLSVDLMNFLISRGVIVKEQNQPNSTDEYYQLNNGVKLVLEDNIMDIIGESYQQVDFKVRFVHTIAGDSTEKFQIKRKMHDNDNKSYNWFRQLYDYNVEGSIFIVYYDQEKNELHIDNKLNYKKLSSLDLDENQMSLRQFYIKNLNNNTHIENEIQNRNKFVDEYPLEKFLTMTKEEYCSIGDENNDSFCYKVENGCYKETGFGIRGSYKSKFGFYYSQKDKVYKDKSNRVVENPDDYWNRLRKQIYDFIVYVKDNSPDFTLTDKFDLLGGSGNYMFLTKLLSLYYPDRFISMQDEKRYAKLGEYFNESFNNPSAIINSYYANISFRKNIPEANENHGFYIANAIWHYFNEENEEEEFDIAEDKQYDLDFLSQELLDFREKYGKSPGTHLFGIKYGQVINKYNISLEKIVAKANISSNLAREINKGVALSNYAKKLMNPLNNIIIDENEDDINIDEDDTYSDDWSGYTNKHEGENKIFYGVPGCGKSFIVNEKYNTSEYKVFRTTFYPDYSNSDFVGQIIPKVIEKKVEYNFVAGPFAKALLYALSNKNEDVALIIEEINRGNAAAIFGDIFQLLDRKNGLSVYPITNQLLTDYLNNNNITLINDEIRIPRNLHIIGTMNTSDQNVFTLDTAFKRRWNMEYIENKIEGSENENVSIIPPNNKYEGIKWGKFVNTINDKIKRDPSGINGEDKQLGAYFVTEKELKNSIEFADKVLSYLWEDIARINPDYWFKKEYRIESYDDLVKKYNEFYMEIFNDFFDVIINDIGEQFHDENNIQ